MGRHERRGRYARPVIGPGTPADNADIVRGLQSKCWGWLIMWSKWRRTYTAFSCATTKALIIDEAEIDRFLARIRQVDQIRRYGR